MNNNIGILGLSVGGGGGDAGASAGLTQLGATGGPGANPGQVWINNAGTIQTNGQYSPGMIAAAVGGGGGRGGMALGVASTIGGSGGDGGNGGAVYALNGGKICTGGPCGEGAVSSKEPGLAPGILAASVGGGGGMGGKGGWGSTVGISAPGSVFTRETVSPGVMGISIGGGGGMGGGAVAMSAGYSSTSVAIGGTGGSGGDGGMVNINCGSSWSTGWLPCKNSPYPGAAYTGSVVVTKGVASPGILGMSVGGGGGMGGFAVSASAGLVNSQSFSVGGNGAQGGNANEVYVANNGADVTTSGKLSGGVVSLSVGGKGGFGGFAFDGSVAGATSIGFSLGGTGGGGGFGNYAGAENAKGTIKTTGDISAALVALSVGGGGGMGGVAASLGVAGGLSINSSVGGKGGSGNYGGPALARNAGTLITTGSNSWGMVGASIGGGGGMGGFALGAGVALGGSVSVTGGGDGGSGGNANYVDMQNDGTIRVLGQGGAGMLAASIGGGGGMGGGAITADVALGGAFTSSTGGKGGAGAAAGNVDARNNGKIDMNDDGSTKSLAFATQGIVALSIGGGGGMGGLSIAGSITGVAGSVTDSVGGGSAGGGTGGNASIHQNDGAYVRTKGALSNGLTAISMGGRGGMGGIAVAGSLTGGSSATVAVGGDAGNAGRAGQAYIWNAGEVTTDGLRSLGILSQSIGGHGGVGGLSLGLGAATGNTIMASTVSIGGEAGNGGAASSAVVETSSASNVTTKGALSAGVSAQSIGGNGGMGGAAFAASATTGISPSLTLGGRGGSGAAGGTAWINSNGRVTTEAAFSPGVLSQSIGGNGGIGGISIAAGSSADKTGNSMQRLGGWGGSGANGGEAVIYNYATVVTKGAMSDGVSVESFGGSGGRAGLTISAPLVNTDNLQAREHESNLGGDTGGGGNGSQVQAYHAGIISTSGAFSSGISAQSVGGGGGAANALWADISWGGKKTTTTMGADRGANGNGGVVIVEANKGLTSQAIQGGGYTNSIVATGINAHGVFAQSLGGGGGRGGALNTQSSAGGAVQALQNLGAAGTSNDWGTAGGGSASDVWVSTGGLIYAGMSSVPGQRAAGFNAGGILAQSLGGGGGASSHIMNVETTLSVDVPGTNLQITAGAGSASSSNGSSGTATNKPSTTVSLSNFSSSTITAGSLSSMALGGYSQSGGNAGKVTIASTSVIQTVGALSDGILAQSVGGGGGSATFADVNSSSPYAAGTSTLGGGAGGNAKGGDVTVTSNGPIRVVGPGSAGIRAQSIGGGGGLSGHLSQTSGAGLGAAFTTGLGATAAPSGSVATAGAVNVTVNGPVYFSGVGSDGVVAQSIAGGGGNVLQFGLASSTFSGTTSLSSSAGAGALSGSVQSGANSANSGSTGGGASGSQVGFTGGASIAGTLGASAGTSRDAALAYIVANGTLAADDTGSLLARNSSALVAQSIGGGGGQIRYFDSNFDGRQSSLSFTLGASGATLGSGGWSQVTQGWTSGSTASVSTLGDNSTAALVQSIGGGGGEARITRITTGAGGSRSAALMLGAHGAAGGKGQDAVLQLGGAVTTGGNSSSAGVVQSIGGGGGFARMAILAGSAGTVNSTSTLSASGGASASSGLAFNAALGSQSASLATGGNVGFESSKTLTTDGARSTAVIAQSIGGGGGVADIVSAGADTGGVASSVILGARNAGGSGTVTATTRGDVTTKGSSSHGVVAQSIGGGGGMSGVTTTGAGAAQDARLATGFGDSGASGAGGAVSINVQSNVTTKGAMSFGLLAQSVAGGGGLASYHLMSGAGATQTEESITFGSTPTSGVAAANAGSATASANYGATNTAGFGSIGVMAQSFAGGGGVSATMIDKIAGDSSIKFASSLERVTAGTAGSATASSSTYVATQGDVAHGLVAQSGVAGGLVMSRYLTASGASATIDLKTGGGLINTIVGQGTSGTAGAASVTTNYVDTFGAASFGAVAQSVPFGGLYTIVTASTDGSSLGSLGGSISLGAAGVATAGTATINSGPSVHTRGAYGIGLLAQSVGGGGGAVVLLASNAAQSTTFNPSMSFGGSAQGTGGATSVTATGSVTTEGAAAHGVLAQSIGGGGGYLAWTGASSGSLAMGTASSNGAGGAVSANVSGAVSTKDALAIGVIAQSVGGGGGLAQGTLLSTATLGGGNFSANNAGGAVAYTQSGSVSTTGTAGVGVLMQSVGGGGGVVFGNARLGGGAGNTANGGAVTATITGSITTTGSFGVGVLAQSVGGGGGLIVNPGSTAAPTSQAGSGSGGNVTVTATGATIRTSGAYAHGIVGQSVGGGGGLAITKNGVSAVVGGGSGSKGTVTINATAGTDVAVTGAGASAVKAFGSVVNVGWGSSLRGGSDGGAGVSFIGDSEHIVNNSGFIGSTLGLLGLAIIADEGATSISNAGFLQGSINLAPNAANLLNNRSGGFIQAGSMINLGAAGRLVNAGVLQAGGGEIGGVTTITGALEQTSSGLLHFAAQPGGGAAKLVIEGKATLGGRLGLQFASPGAIREGRFEHNGLIEVKGDFVDGGLSGYRTAIIDSKLLVNGGAIGLDTTSDFSPAGLSGGGARLGSMLGGAQEQERSALHQAMVARLVTAPDVSSLERAYSNLAANPVSAVVQSGLQTAQSGMASFSEQADRWRNGAVRPLDKTLQTWITPRASFGSFSAQAGNLSTQTLAVSAGVDVQASPDVLVGFGVVGAQNKLTVGSAGMSATQDAGGAGFYGMAKFGQAYLSAAAYIGVDHNKFGRSYAGVARGSATLDGTVAGGRIELGYTFPVGDVRLTPFVAFEPAGRWQNSATESMMFEGAREAGLTYDAQLTRSLPVIAGMQLDADIKLPNGSTIKGYLRGGFAHEFNTDRDLTKSLPGLRNERFTSGGEYAAANAGFARLGAEYKAWENVSFFADVSSQFAAQGSSFGGRAGVQVRW